MERFFKMLYLVARFEDPASRWMIFYEWLNNDPIIDVRFRMETKIEMEA